MSTRPPRSTWTNLSDAERLAQCEVDTYRASGPGGQKRNKTSSAVRLRHAPTGVIVIAEESRSQHENKAKALRRLYRAFFLDLRDDVPRTAEEWQAIPEWQQALSPDGRIHLSAKDVRFWPAAGLALDLLNALEAQVSTAAELLGISTANLIAFLQSDPKLWQEANRLRAACGQKPLRLGK
ncbi:peptide chain release factor family protein [Limnoglobus roseus]|uniref:Peptide chain release factor-like protein n=1 Tax=Limnoglobus roseus TaxID=2598579 RepID=A0A5C1AAW7_9BACT|nr:peptide chain release factor-like protein [Limnoglobus roseus]QEL15715.1 peptide chain release factor-like protein [Limnoglobus roseus]